MSELAQKQNQTQKANSITPARSRKVTPEPSMEEHPILRLQRRLGNQAVLSMLRSREQVKRTGEPQLQRKADEPEQNSNATELKDKAHHTEEQKIDRSGNTDEAVHWWAPFGERIAKWGFGGVVTHTNIDRKTIADYESPWKRNAMDAAVFAVGTGVATEVVLKRLKLADMAAKAVGMGITFGTAYEGLDVRERIRCKTIDSYSWYGRYRYNYSNNEILGVEYWDKGATTKSMISPVYHDQAIVDADGKVLFVYTHQLAYLGINLDSKIATLPLFSYGKVDQD